MFSFILSGKSHLSKILKSRIFLTPKCFRKSKISKKSVKVASKFSTKNGHCAFIDVTYTFPTKFLYLFLELAIIQPNVPETAIMFSNKVSGIIVLLMCLRKNLTWVDGSLYIFRICHMRDELI